MANRKAISTRTRFEVFKRDGFKCQYCGKSAPQVVLECDHIDPVSNGGGNDLLNLITSCWECNSGKSDKLLSDDAAVTKQIDQLQELNERRHQLEMMLEWKKSLRGLGDIEVQHVVDIWREESGTVLNEVGIASVKKLIKSFGLDRVVQAMEIACGQYSDREMAFSKIGGICFVKQKAETDPIAATVAMARGILLKKGCYVGYEIDANIRAAFEIGFDHEDVIECARTARNWTVFNASLR